MCLYIDHSVEIKFNEEGYIYANKLVIYLNNRIFSPFYPHFSWKSGWNVVEDLNDMSENGVLNKGLHVYLCDGANEKFFSMYNCKVKCYKEDLIDVGYDSARNECAAFKKVWLDQEEYDKIKKAY
jgi:hypothetical protein